MRAFEYVRTSEVGDALAASERADAAYLADGTTQVDLMKDGVLLQQSARTRVTRVLLPGGVAAIRKEPLGLDAQPRLRHEVAILERLRGVDGVAQ
ncbi:hypothetical protein AB0K15_47835, partial [Amycolatopsis sp. NPDC049253]